MEDGDMTCEERALYEEAADEGFMWGVCAGFCSALLLHCFYLFGRRRGRVRERRAARKGLT